VQTLVSHVHFAAALRSPVCCRRVCNLSPSAAASGHEDDINLRRFLIRQVRDYAQAFLACDGPALLSDRAQGLFWDHYAYIISKAVNRSDAHDRRAQ
jgi:hypothetical protein